MRQIRERLVEGQAIEPAEVSFLEKIAKADVIEGAPLAVLTLLEAVDQKKYPRARLLSLIAHGLAQASPSEAALKASQVRSVLRLNRGVSDRDDAEYESMRTKWRNSGVLSSEERDYLSRLFVSRDNRLRVWAGEYLLRKKGLGRVSLEWALAHTSVELGRSNGDLRTYCEFIDRGIRIRNGAAVQWKSRR